ncbi:related to human RANBPM NP_005484.1 [Cephalotrichum gorgonifer]|uniref:Related to human RANBPM NP_005484.1 n=1 Tax=Cephalotrichum gorgonifer TaxID=2041049 RepID=A0AAE8SR60_9PEZI|nr:related to human RANBPM NP_005484.1 [Cephalotrichum gorgonifer]
MSNSHSGNPSGYSSNSSRNHFSYVSIGSPRVPGSGPGFYHHPSRISALAQFLHQDPDMTSDSAIDETEPYSGSNHYSSVRSREMANDQYFQPPNAASTHPAAGSASRPTHLPSFSRAFELFTTPPFLDDTQRDLDDFFIPSYLSDTAYALKLREAHQAKLKARRANRSRDGPATAPLTSPSPANNGLPTKPPQQSESASFDIIEKPATQDDDPSVVPPLPSKWSKTDRWPSGIDVMNEGLEVRYTSHKSGSEYEAASIRADHPIPPECGIYYFEVAITYGKRDDTTIGIGLSTKSAQLSRPPGWETDSWGYHGDDGHCFHDTNCGKTYGPKYTTGDIVGCGINFNTGCIFFTKNGHNLGAAFRDVKGQLYPSVGLKKYGEHIRTNFGHTPFVFDIDGMMRREKRRIQDEIWNTSPSSLELRLDGAPVNLGETDLIQSLVLQFLQHDGYVETARAFAQEIQSERQALTIGTQDAPTINVKDDQDATNRQQIRKAILEGDIDRALRLIDTCYPSVLVDNELVYFKLKCRRFIEMVRTAAEIRSHYDGGKKATNGVDPSQAMDVDTNGVEGVSWENMDTEDGLEYLGELQDLERDLIEYGQQLQAEYRNDLRKEVQKTLEDIWSLMAYPNPLREPKVAHLMDNKERAKAAETVNSMILISLGKSSSADLTKLYEDTSSLVRDLREGGPGAFFSMKDITAAIPKPEDV